MTFEALHKWVLYGVVVLGLLPIGTSGEVPLPFIVATFGATIASWFYEPPRQRIEARTRWWNLATVGAFLALAGVGWVTGNYLLYAVIFALLMVVTRLFQSRSSRDVFQLYGLSFIAMIAGAVINPTLSFVFIFIAYVVLLVWGLIFLHLQRDIEALNVAKAEAGERPSDLAWRARGLVTGRFLLGSSTLALAIFASSLLFFFFFPRLGMGFFFSQGRGSQSVSGFSDRIELGHFGTIKDSMQVVMRVEFPGDLDEAGRHLRMRGISFDHYDGRVWSKTSRETQELPQQKLGTWLRPPEQGAFKALPGERVTQRIYLEPLDMDQRMIFGQPRIARLAVDSPELNRLRLRRHQVRFFADGSGDVSTRVSNDVALRYTVDSYVQRRSATALSASDRATVPPSIAAVYLQLPERLDPAVSALAAQVTAGSATAFEKAVAIETFLLESYDYSTEGGHDPTRPLESFLFERKAGHCEYFASAMSIMLRTVGVPARPSNGFFGGVYNEFGRFYTVRQADAHSWVEVYFPSYGWVTFDPTPPSAVLVPAEGGVVGTFKAWFDSLRLQWYKWVVEYDLEKQLAFFRAVGDAMGSLRDIFPSPQGSARSRRAWGEGFKAWAKRPATWLAFGLPILLLLLWRFGILRRLWRALARMFQRGDVVPAGAAGALYHRMLKALTRQGVGRHPTETPRELATRLRTNGYEAADPVARITAAFEAARYAGREPERDLLDTLESDLGDVRRVKL